MKHWNTRWFRAVHESGHAVMCKHLGFDIGCITAIGQGATLSRLPESLTRYQLEMRALGGLAAEIVVFGPTEVYCEGGAWWFKTIAVSDLENLGFTYQDALSSPAFRQTLGILKRKKARIIKIAEALIKHDYVDSELHPLSADDLQKFTGAIILDGHTGRSIDEVIEKLTREEAA